MVWRIVSTGYLRDSALEHSDFRTYEPQDTIASYCPDSETRLIPMRTRAIFALLICLAPSGRLRRRQR